MAKKLKPDSTVEAAPFSTPNWPDMNAKMWKLGKIKPYPNNPRTHPENQIALLSKMLRQWGPDQPIVVDEDGVILKGHGRLAAATLAGLEEFPVVVRSGLADVDKRAIRIADNQVALLSGWDSDAMRLEIGELKLQGFDIPLLGFGEHDLNAIIISEIEGQTDPEKTPDPPKKPIVRLGDVWVLGNHRVVCGDSTRKDDVVRATNGVKPNLCITDPPYGVEYDPNWRNETDRANGKPYGDRAVGKVSNDDRADWREAWALFPGDVFYCWHAGRHASAVQTSLESVGFEIVCQIIWAKDRLIISRGDYHWKHEPCWYAVRKGKRHNWQGDRSQTTLWEVQHQKSETGHGTQKPIECMKRPMLNNSKKGEWVYDPFLGSGTTLIAAEMTGRKCCGLELDPAYVEVIVRRWQEFTGKLATLETGQTLDEITKERRTGRALTKSENSKSADKPPRAGRKPAEAPQESQ